MTDIFREIEEDLRRDRITRIWERHGSLIVALAAAIVLAVAGWRYWAHSRDMAAAAMGARFEQAIDLARAGKSAEAEKALEGIIADATSGYDTLARFRLAAETGKRDPRQGVAAFEAIAGDPSVSETLQGLARLRGAMLILDAADPQDAAKRLETLAAPTNPWRHTARELLGLATLKAGDYDAAGRWFDQIAVDAETPATLRQRSQLYLALVRAGPVTPAPTQ